MSELEQKLSQHYYTSWLARKNEPHPEDLEATIKPKEILTEMLKVKIERDGIRMTAIEAIVGDMVVAALNGDRAMARKLFDELEHDGATAINHTVTIGTSESSLSPAARTILARNNVIDISPDDTQEPQEEQQPLSIAQPTEKPLSVADEAHIEDIDYSELYT